LRQPETSSEPDGDLSDDSDENGVQVRRDAEGVRLCSQEGCDQKPIMPYAWCGGARYCGKLMTVHFRSADTKEEFELDVLRHAGVRNLMRKLVYRMMGEKYSGEYQERPYRSPLYDHDQFELWYEGKQLDFSNTLVDLQITEGSLIVYIFRMRGHVASSSENLVGETTVHNRDDTAIDQEDQVNCEGAADKAAAKPSTEGVVQHQQDDRSAYNHDSSPPVMAIISLVGDHAVVAV